MIQASAFILRPDRVCGQCNAGRLWPENSERWGIKKETKSVRCPKGEEERIGEQVHRGRGRERVGGEAGEGAKGGGGSAARPH